MVDRDILTIEGAVTEAIRVLGAKRIAARCNVSPTAVYAWASTNKPASISTLNAALVDRLYREHTCEPGPFCRLYRRLDRLSEAEQRPLVRLALLTCSRVGKVTGLVELYTQPNSEAGDELSQNEARDLVKAGEAAETVLTELISASMARL